MLISFTYPNRTPTFEWYVVRFSSIRKWIPNHASCVQHKFDYMFKNMVTTLVKGVGEGEDFNEHENFHLNNE